LFKSDWFDVVDVAPANAERCRGWDTAGTEGGGDYTVGVKIAKAHGLYYVEDVRRGQWSPHTVDAEMMRAAFEDGRACRQREEQEPGSSGKSVIAHRVRQLDGYD
jgi:phage terminase large subunit-like protein